MTSHLILKSLLISSILLNLNCFWITGCIQKLPCDYGNNMVIDTATVFSPGAYDFKLSTYCNHIYSDMTWVGDKLVGFTSSSDDLESSSGRIEINYYDNGFTYPYSDVKIISHFWGHCNTVDYNELNDCLILGNGSGSYQLGGVIIIIPSFSKFLETSSSSETYSLTQSGAIIIDCSDYNLGSKFNVIWGDSADIAYLMTANINGSTKENGGDLETIRKIKLCKGQKEGKFGNINFVGDQNTFNGTFDILSVYRQKTDGYTNCDQGTCYNKGYIYAAIGHNGFWYWKMSFDNYSIIRKEFKESPPSSNNISGMCVNGGYLFWGQVGLGIKAVHI